MQGRAVPAPSREDMLIFLSIKGARHNRAELKQICDLAGVLSFMRICWTVGASWLMPKGNTSSVFFYEACFLLIGS